MNITVTDSIFVHDSPFRLIYVATGTDGFTFERNVIVGLGASLGRYVDFHPGTTPDNTNSTFDNNVYYATGSLTRFAWDSAHGNYTDLADWKLDTGQDPNSLEQDPLFVDWEGGDYRIYDDSPAIELGFDADWLIA